MAVRLGIDASQHTASCAVSIGLKIIARMTVDKPVENLTSLIQSTLLKSHVALHELDEIVVCIGPGSNLGSRTAVVTGNALSLALDIPISSVISTDALSAFSPYLGIQNIAVPAGRGRWYIAKYACVKDKITRVKMPELVDQLPIGTDDLHTFTPDDYKEGFNCAEGVLKIAEQQRHLLSQVLLREVKTFEQGATNV